MINEKVVADLQKRWKKLYNSQEGLVGIDYDKVHIRLNEMKRLMDIYGNWTVKDNKLDYTGTMDISKWEVSIFVHGAKFIALGDDEDLEQYNIPMPTPIEDWEE